MRLLITGGYGFIGSNCIRRILSTRPNDSICNVDALTYAGNPANLADILPAYPKRYSFEQADIADSTAMRRIFEQFSPDAVINFAAETHVDRSIVDASPFIRTNVMGVEVLLSLAKEYRTPRFVHVSTDEVYGSLGPTGKFTETTPLDPNSPYSASKAGGDLLCKAYHATYNFPVVITRCSNNYGPYQFPEKLIPLMHTRAQQGQALPVYGDGLNVRDWIHVDDHCQGVLLALDKGTPGAVYNFGGNAERTNLAVVRGILGFCNQPESLIHYVKDRPGHDRRYAMDSSLAEKELGFAPAYTFENGLHATLTWYKEHPAWVEAVTSGTYRDFMQQWYKERV